MTDLIIRLNDTLEGRYRVECLLGEGGMARVYLARDSRHDRRVALKVLKGEVAAGVGGDRFLAEIRTTANLQHPNILPLHDSGEADGLLFYVMPYVEGESLRDRLDRERQLSVDDAVRIASDAARALDYAHRHGVIHRDIKPGNLLLQDGRPVISDFGIALAVGSAGAGRLTETGLSLGTPHYMSPEQATGDEYVGPPADIYALGCVLYEMLVGEPPHTASSPQAILGKILTEPPPRTAPRRSAVPANVDAAVAKALEKIPADRFRTAGDFAAALTDSAFRSPTPVAAGQRARVGAGAVVAASALLASLVFVALTNRFGPGGGEDRRPVARYALSLPEATAFRETFENSVALSPDGQRLVYTGPGDADGTALWLKERDRLRPRRLPGTAGAVTPFFSPDGTRIAYVEESTRSLYTLDLETGQRIALAGDLGLVGGSWGDDGYIYATDRESAAIARYSESSGTREFVTELREGERAHVRAEILSGSEGLVYQIWDLDGRELLAIERFDDSSREVIEGLEPQRALYASSGHLLVVHLLGNLWAAPFDAERVELLGDFSIVETGVSVAHADQGADIAVARDGTLVYMGAVGGARTAAWFDRSGRSEAIEYLWPGGVESVALAPDGERFLVTLGEVLGTEIWMASVDRPDSPTLFAMQGELTRRPVWFAGGDSVAFIAEDGRGRNAYVKATHGPSEPTLLLDLERDIDEIVVAGDSWLVYRAGTGAVPGDRDIYAIRRGTGAEPVAVAADPSIDEASPTLSPDGRYLAYVAFDDRIGRSQVWVRPFPDVQAGAWLVAGAGGGAGSPRWSSDGSELFYAEGRTVMSARIGYDEGFELLETRPLFMLDETFVDPLNTNYGVSPDGERFLMPLFDAPNELVLVEGFHEELRRRAPR